VVIHLEEKWQYLEIKVIGVMGMVKKIWNWAFLPSEVVPRTAAIEHATFRDRMDRDFSGRGRPSLSIGDTSKANDVCGCGRIHLEATAWAYVIA
jgi:hypothetical protein